jgi:myo-inositol-1(or 4)-monophosphatase
VSNLEGIAESVRAAAQAAGELAQRCRESRSWRLKPDGSIVTNGDLEVEAFLKDRLLQIVGGSGFWGEEGAFEGETPAGLWAVDPIDGTSNYAFGSPLWGVSVAFIRGGEPLLGCIALPDLGEIYLSWSGGGVFRNGVRLPPIPAGPVQPYELVSYSEHVSRQLDSKLIPGKMRSSGALVIEATFTLCQRFRGMIGVREKLYDIAAAVLMARELGADVRYADGAPLVARDLIADVHIAKPWLIFPKESGFVVSLPPA